MDTPQEPGGPSGRTGEPRRPDVGATGGVEPHVEVSDGHGPDPRLLVGVARTHVELLAALLRGDDGEEAVAVALPRMRRLLGADVAWVALLAGPLQGAVVVAQDGAATRGEGPSALLTADDVRRVLEDGRVVTDDGARDLPSLAAAAPRAARLVAHPLGAPDGGHAGIIAFGRHEGARCFGDEELDAVTGLAHHVGAALELADAQHAARRQHLLADHDRMARDLHETVVQQLFGIGLRLEAVRPLAAAPVAGRIAEAVAGLDTVVADLRTVIFDLHTPAGEADGLRRAVLRRTHEMHDLLGFVPHVRFRGEVDTTVTDAQSEQVLAVLREALANIVRHARATDASIVVDVTEAVRLTVTDDGVGGAAPSPRGRGLQDLRARAEASGGTFTVTERAGGGTVLVWSVPRRGSDRR